MRTVQVPLANRAQGTARIEDGATVGATFGVNLYVIENGVPRLAVASDFATAAAAGGPISASAWSILLDIPANVRALEGAAGTGLFAVTGAGTGAFRTIQPVAGETTVSNGNGVAGDPVVGLADVADAGGGAILKFTRDAKGRVSGTSAATTTDLTEGSNLYFTQARVQATPLPSFTVATLPTPTAGLMIYVTDESGGAVPAFGDGANFRRVTDRAIVS